MRARVAELADALDLGSSAERRAGSSPAPSIDRGPKGRAGQEELLGSPALFAISAPCAVSVQNPGVVPPPGVPLAPPPRCTPARSATPAAATPPTRSAVRERETVTRSTDCTAPREIATGAPLQSTRTPGAVSRRATRTSTESRR